MLPNISFAATARKLVHDYLVGSEVKFHFIFSVSCARKNGIPAVVRSGGHSYEVHIKLLTIKGSSESTLPYTGFKLDE